MVNTPYFIVQTYRLCTKWKGWHERFYSDKPGDVDPSWENASIESRRQGIFKLAISIELLSLRLFASIVLYRIAATKALS